MVNGFRVVEQLKTQAVLNKKIKTRVSVILRHTVFFLKSTL
ncbi:hypothetical protein N824_00870 [Pedobacter sp. V48]|nr:hypothetical protein N824_00870 [Pedobacter sp. V48]